MLVQPPNYVLTFLMGSTQYPVMQMNTVWREVPKSLKLRRDSLPSSSKIFPPKSCFPIRALIMMKRSTRRPSVAASAEAFSTVLTRSYRPLAFFRSLKTRSTRKLRKTESPPVLEFPIYSDSPIITTTKSNTLNGSPRYSIHPSASIFNSISAVKITVKM